MTSQVVFFFETQEQANYNAVETKHFVQWNRKTRKHAIVMTRRKDEAEVQKHHEQKQYIDLDVRFNFKFETSSIRISLIRAPQTESNHQTRPAFFRSSFT